MWTKSLTAKSYNICNAVSVTLHSTITCMHVTMPVHIMWWQMPYGKYGAISVFNQKSTVEFLL